VAISSIDDYLRVLKASFNPVVAGNCSRVLQYEFSGRVQGVAHVAIAEGEIHVGQGPHPSPTVVVHSDFDLWLRVISHDLDGLMAYQDGLFTIDGDVITLMDSDLWFRPL
jgi:putative sterol carrier protein